MQFLRFQFTVEQFDISTAAIDILLMLDRVLDDEILTVVAERGEFLGQPVEPGVLRRLNSFVGLGIVVESARAVDEFTELFAGVFRVRPLSFPRIWKTIKRP